MADRPNVILIMVDQWRGDCLSIDGHPVVHTPFLDQLALNGVRFSRAYSAVPTCIAARAALFTGLSQCSHGRVGYQDGVPWDYPVTLAGEFTRHGYQTQAVGKMHVYPERSQLGFQNVVLHDGFLHFARAHNPNYEMVDDYIPWLREQLGHDADYFDHGVNCNSVVARPWDKPEHLHPTNYVVTQAIDFLRRRDPRKPFFLFVSFHRPHPPFDPPAWAMEQYLREPMPDVPVGDWAGLFGELAEPHRPDLQAGEIDPRVLRRARAGYYGHMTHIDHQINRFLERLAEYGQLESSYICFVSDHGELLGDHHLFRKALPFEGSARVPLILAGPRGSSIQENAICPPVVELRDVMPTLLECAGLPVPASVEGRSVLPFARGEQVGPHTGLDDPGVSSSAAVDTRQDPCGSPQAPWREYLHGEHLYSWGRAGRRQSIHWLTDGRQKYVWLSGPGAELLFDLDNDPQELHDLAPDPSWAPRLAAWRARLVQELAGREEGFSDGERLVPGRPVRPSLSCLRCTGDVS